MALVDYPSSDEEREEDPEEPEQKKQETEPGLASREPSPSLKRKRDAQTATPTAAASALPPLPSRFHDLYASTTRVSTRDDPSLHGGRKRVTPHVEGNWPTHLYIEWYPATTEYTALTKVIASLREAAPPQTPPVQIHSFLTSDLGAPLPLHISLSRPIGFATEHKDGFAAALDRTIKSAGIRPFAVQFSGLDWVANFKKTRWFLVLRICRPDANGLNRLLHICNAVVQDHGQPPLYVDNLTSPTNEHLNHRSHAKKHQSSAKGPGAVISNSAGNDLQDASDAFHVSIAWTLSSPSSELISLTKSMMGDVLQDLYGVKVNVEEIKSKVGNVVTNLPLLKNKVDKTSLFGF